MVSCWHLALREGRDGDNEVVEMISMMIEQKGQADLATQLTMKTEKQSPSSEDLGLQPSLNSPTSSTSENGQKQGPGV